MIERSFQIAVGTVNIATTEVQDGDFAIDGDPQRLAADRLAVAPTPWSWLEQVHGGKVYEVRTSGEHSGRQGDGYITLAANATLSVTTADCAPVVLIGGKGIAVLHAGWRSLQADIISKGATMLLSKGVKPVASYLGPCISAAKYEFGEPELSLLAQQFGEGVRSETADGKPALAMDKAVAAACEKAGWPAPAATACTSGEQWFSHRVRQDKGRIATVAWIS